MQFARNAAPWPDTLTAGGVRTWLLGSGQWEGSLDADSLPIDDLERFAPAAHGWGGRVTGHLGIGGDPRHPVLDLAAEARSLRRDSLVADAATARLSYRDGRLDVPDLKIVRGAARSTISGSMPLHLDMVAAPVVPDQPMTWRVEVTNGDLSMLPLITPQIAQARGRVDLAARIEGTTRKPTLDGTVQVRGGVMAPAGREEVLEDVYANLRLSRSRIMLDTLYAREGRRGQVTGHGVIDLQGSALKSYRVDLALHEFTIHEAGFYVALINGNVAVADGPRVSGHTLPMITGDIQLERGVIVFDFANAAEQERLAATTQPLLWTYRIHLLANSNLRWQPPDGDIEFSADLTLEQTPGALSIWGDMHALRGTYHFLSNKFTVVKADVTFDNVGGINPVLDAQATTRVVPTQEPQAGLTAPGADGRALLRPRQRRARRPAGQLRDAQAQRAARPAALEGIPGLREPMDDRARAGRGILRKGRAVREGLEPGEPAADGELQPEAAGLRAARRLELLVAPGRLRAQRRGRVPAQPLLLHHDRLHPAPLAGRDAQLGAAGRGIRPESQGALGVLV
jgi:hypothetical protein